MIDPEKNRAKWWRQEITKLKDAAPNMTLRDALGFVDHWMDDLERAERSADALAILAVDVCGMGENGDIKSLDIRRKIAVSPRLQMALSEALHIHAGWQCGIGPGIEALLEWADDEGLRLRNSDKLSFRDAVEEYESDEPGGST